MATTQEELDLAFTRVGSEFKSVRALAGLLANLSTADKSSLVAAINEVNAKTAGAGAQIDDVTARTTTVYSSSRTETRLTEATAALKADILGGAGPTVDTLKELADILAGSTSDVAALTTALSNRVRFDAAQTLTAPQKVQANANIGSVSLAQLGDPAHSYRDVFLAALV